MSLSLLFVLSAWAQSEPPEPFAFEARSQDGQVTGEVLAVLGARHNLPDYNGRIELGASLDAEFGARIDCGAIRFEGDFNAVLPDVSEVPEQLASAGMSFLNALPMLTVCHTSPSLCAELKNLNFRIDEEWDFSAEICKAMDTYIDDQAEKGEREARNRWKRECTAEFIAGADGEQGTGDDGDPAAAVRHCETEEPEDGYLVTDIAQGFVTRTFSDEPQKLVRAALTATQTELSQNEGFYEFLVAVGGEAELRHNGVAMPLFPPGGSLLAEELADAMKFRAMRTACVMPLREVFGSLDEQSGVFVPGDPVGIGQATNDEAEMYWRGEMFDIFSNEFTQRDAENLYLLDTGVFWVMCERLSEVVVAETVNQLQKQVTSEVALMAENPALGELGHKKLKDIERAIEALKRQLDGEELPSIPAYRLQLERMADAIRDERRNVAGSLSSGEVRNEELRDTWKKCKSYRTCGGQ